jgi:hypothetical protein
MTSWATDRSRGQGLNLPSDVLQRMLLFMNPHVGQSVDRVYQLAKLYGEISVDAARRLIAIWRDADRSETVKYNTDRLRGAQRRTMRGGLCRRFRAGPS